MNATSLNQKTVRPGSLVGYSYYHSKRRPNRSTNTAKKTHARPKLPYRRLFVAVALVALVLVAVSLFRHPATQVKQTAANSKLAVTAPKTSTPPAKAAPAVAALAATNHCAGNSLDRFVLVSIGQRHLWACQGSTTAYDSPVVTGIQYLAADLTPTGTYHIYDKQTDLTLSGSDSTGSWNDPVSYWMPFLHNQYGSYGFHDATWRAPTDFGNISPNSADASHGCVELPLATAAWLYNWASVGTTVTIEN